MPCPVRQLAHSNTRSHPKVLLPVNRRAADAGCGRSIYTDGAAAVSPSLIGYRRVRMRRVFPPPASEDNPRPCSQVQSGRCQQGSRIVSAAFVGIRSQLTNRVVPGIHTFADDRCSPSPRPVCDGFAAVLAPCLLRDGMLATCARSGGSRSLANDMTRPSRSIHPGPGPLPLLVPLRRRQPRPPQTECGV